MKKLLLVLIVLAVVLAGVAFAISKLTGHRATADDYTLAPAEFGTLSESVSATGLLQPEETLAINTAVPGRVVQVNADVNQVVEEGEVLAQLDDRLAQADLHKAQIGVDMAKIGVRRAQDQLAAAKRQRDKQEQLPEGVGMKLDLETAEDQIKAAEAGVSLAQAQVRQAQEEVDRATLAFQFTTIKVPTIERPEAGSARGSIVDTGARQANRASAAALNRPKVKYIVLDRRVALNQMVSAAAPPMLSASAGAGLGPMGSLGGGAAMASTPLPSGGLFTLAGDLAHMRIRAQIAEGDISKVHKGQGVEFTVSTYAEEDRHFHGKVADVHQQPNSVGGAVYYEALIDVSNERDPQSGDWQLRPGMTASVDVVRKKADNTWKVPTTALAVQIDNRQLTPAAKEKLDRPPTSPSPDAWHVVWVLAADQKPWPLFVRLGELRDSTSQQVLEWDPELQPRPDPKAKSTYPRLIISAPAEGKEGGLFKAPPIRF